MKTTFVLFLIVTLASCSSPRVYVDYDNQVDFNQFKSFQFYDDMQTDLSELDENRFKEALLDALQQKNMVSSENPVFKVNFYSKVYEVPSSTSIGLGVGGGGGAVGGGVSGGIPIGGNKVMMSITLEFVTASTNELAWQAIVEAPFRPTMTPEERNAFFQKMALKALEKFPPKGKE